MAEVERSAIFWPDPLTGPWHVELASLPIAGRPELVGLLIRSYDVPKPWPESGFHAQPPVPLTTAVLRSLNIGRLSNLHRQTLAMAADYVAHELQAQSADHVTGELAGKLRARADSYRATPPARRIGRPRSWTPDRLEEVAQVYRNAWTRGDAPTKAVAEHFDKSLSFAAKLVTQARSAGLLPATRAGKAWAGTPPGGEDAQ